MRTRSGRISERICAILRALAVRLRLPSALLPARLMARTAIDVSEKAGVRYLHFSSAWVQGAMRIQRPYALELPYPREMMAVPYTHLDVYKRQHLTISI